MPSEQGRRCTVHHLPVQVVEQLDKKFGALLAHNGGFAEWILKIDHGMIRYVKSTETEFLEPTDAARKQPA